MCAWIRLFFAACNVMSGQAATKDYCPLSYGAGSCPSALWRAVCAMWQLALHYTGSSQDRATTDDERPAGAARNRLAQRGI